MVVVLPNKFPGLSRIEFPADDDVHLTRVPNGHWVAVPLKDGGVKSGFARRLIVTNASTVTSLWH